MSDISRRPQYQPAATDFQKPQATLASSPAGQILKFERADWSLFRTLEGLMQKAGVAKSDLPKLVLKELADNGWDEGATEVHVGRLQNGGGYFVEDNGHGIEGTPEDIARLFSIARPMVSTKLLRLPTRGALGNGLRVVAGTVLASEGSLVITTRAQRIVLRPERDGTTTVVSAEPLAHVNPIGTKIEITFGPALIVARDTIFSWANIASDLAGLGSTYHGGSSPHWYDATQFHELLYATGPKPVRELIAHLDGCSGGKAGEIVAAAGLSRTLCTDIASEQAKRLLIVARDNTRQVQSKRLGAIGQDAYPSASYGYSSGVVQLGSATPLADIPYVVEAWAERLEQGKTLLTICVNRTPITGQVHGARENRDIEAWGCGLHHVIAEAPKAEQFGIIVNIITPYMPITSDGKAPDLKPFVGGIKEATTKAVRKAHRPNAGSGRSQKDVVLDNLDAAIASVSGDGVYRFNERQVFYVLREVVMKATGQELKINNFKTIITDYEAENAEIPLMYREPRGSIYHPHTGETITLGTLMVEDYERPAWTFNALVYFEKEGWSEALKDDRWPERHDCMLMSSKGFTTRAARDLVDKLAEHDEPVTIFCVHDADAAGTMIYQTFQEATKARGARKVEIVNLGLEPWEAVDMGLSVENVEAGERRKPVADYVRALDDEDWEEWLQTHRIELNAMTTPQLIDWLDQKMARYEKLIPPEDVLSDELDQRIEENVRSKIMDRILRETGFKDQVAAAIADIEKPDGSDLAKGIKKLFEQEEDREWRDHIRHVADLKSLDVK
jgi:hypothetical protein